MRFRSACLILVVLWCQACITPPPPPDSTVLDPIERDVLASMRRGKEYLGSNRPELAELEFRHVLAISTATTTLMNDLGYVFERQERYDDAVAAYRKALQLNAKNVVARESLARVLYSIGDSEGGIRELLLVSEQLAVYTDERIRQITGRSYTAVDKRSVLRTIAAAYFRAGYEDEAICYTRKALAMGEIDWSLVSYYSRLLMVTGHVGVAAGYLRDVIGVWQDNAPTAVYLDYGISLYALGDRASAREAFQKVLERKNADFDDRRNAGLLQISLLKTLATPPDVDKLKEGLTADDTFCDTVAPNKGDYWPDVADIDAKAIVREICGEKGSHV